MFYEIMHRESCVAQLSTTGECRVCLEDFMPYDLVLVESDDFDERINNVTNFYYWCASRMLTLDRTYAKEILNSIGASQSVTDRERSTDCIILPLSVFAGCVLGERRKREDSIRGYQPFCTLLKQCACGYCAAGAPNDGDKRPSSGK